MRRRVPPLLGAALLAAAALRCEAAPSPPDAWIEASNRFENFLKVRASTWPKSGLTVSKDGEVELDGVVPNARNSGIFFFMDGAEWASVALRTGARKKLAMFGRCLPGVQAVCFRQSGDLGYQYYPPLVWFEVVPEPGAELTLFGGDNRTIRAAAAPEPASDYWPNERMLAWLDFHTLPKRHPGDINKANEKVTPSVFLQAGIDGVIHRKKLDDPAAEAALVWRIFHNGRLVEKSSARNSTQLPTASHGPGNCIALAGIDTAGGFFPVSNLLSFHLAPGRDGRLALLFSQHDYGIVEDYPIWYRDILPRPHGRGPIAFANEGDLKAARRLVAAWRGCREFSNDPGASWVYRGAAGRDE